MCKTEHVESAIYEYTSLVSASGHSRSKRLHEERLVRDLCSGHDWTESGARAIVSLAHDYGAFMLRNALALAIALKKEDGDLGF